MDIITANSITRWCIFGLLFLLNTYLHYNNILDEILKNATLITFYGIIKVFHKIVIYGFCKDLQKRNFLYHLLDFNKKCTVIISVSFALTVFGFILNYDYMISDSPVEAIIRLLGLLYLTEALNFDDCSFNRSLWMKTSNGLDYGSGMAYSYFYGYLALVLPERGDQNMGIKETMTLYESKENIKFAIKKLFILVPTDLYCPPDLSHVTEGRNIHFIQSKPLAPTIIDRAGTLNRRYHNSVYKIIHNGCVKIYVAAEGASPLLTLYNSIKSGHHSAIYKTHSIDIVNQFYNTLNNLIKSENYSNFCELIYYDNETNDINIAEILYKKICDIQDANK